MKKVFKIPFAYDAAGTIYDYTTAKKGIDYHCTCGEVVRIRGGAVIRNHFYHVNPVECSSESIIHQAYKEVLLRSKKLLLPRKYNGQLLIEFDEVILEKRIADFIPDAIGIKAGQKYLVEFANTSYIHERKLSKIKRANLFCIEVSISPNVESIEEIESHMVAEQYSKRIVHAPTWREVEVYKAQLLKRYNSKVAELERKQEEEMKKLTEYASALNSLVKYKSIGLEYLQDTQNGALMFVNKHNGLVAFLNENGSLRISLDKFRG